MSAPALDTLDREKDKLWLTDAEIIRRMGVPERAARDALAVLDKNPALSGFPQKQKLWGGRRYWPAVKAYFDRKYGMMSDRRG